MHEDTICAVILAAGKGTRMKSARAKVLHRVFGRPMVNHVVERVRAAGIRNVVVVTGHQAEEVEAALDGDTVRFARQAEQLGTGHAVRCAEAAIPADCDRVLILCGDTPLVEPATLASLVAEHRDAAVTVLTTVLDDPTNYGRVITDDAGNVKAIVEEKDADTAQRAIREVNTGIYCVERQFLFDALARLRNDNSQGEYYLTDIVAIAVGDGRPVGRVVCADPREVIGINSRIELARAEAILQEAKHRQLMAAGVTIVAPDCTFIGSEVEIGADTVIHPHVHLRGRTVIGTDCTIEPFCLLEDCRVADGVRIGAGSHRYQADISTDEAAGRKLI